MLSKTQYSTLSTEKSQWMYSINSLSKYEPVIRKTIFAVHQRRKTSKIRTLQTFHKDHVRSKFSMPGIQSPKSRNRFFITYNDTLQGLTKDRPDTTLTSRKIPLNLEKPFIYTFNDIISTSLGKHSDNFLKKETCSQFLDKTKAMVISKCVDLYQNEKLRQVNEVTSSQFQEIDKRTFNLNKGKQLLQEFTLMHNKYLMFLYSKLEEEKRIKESLKNYISKLNGTINQLNNNVNRVYKLLENSKQYKIFLLLVKFKVNSISKIPSNKLQYYGITQADEKESFFKIKTLRSMKRTSIIKKLGSILSQTKRTNESQNNSPINQLRRRRSRKSSQMNLNDKLNQDEELKINNPEIFDSPEEFIVRFKELEDNTAELFATFNEMTYSSQALYKERDNNKTIVDQFEMNDEKKILNRTIELNQLKEKNEALLRKYNNEKESLDNYSTGKRIYRKIQQTLFNLPLEFEYLFDRSFLFSSMQRNTTTVFVLGKRVNMIIYALQALEKVLIYFIAQFHYYKKDSKHEKKLKRLLIALERKKRYEKSKLNQSLELQRREKLNQQIYDKYVKTLYIPRRKIDKAHHLKNSRNKPKVVTDRNSARFNYEELLTF